jgi:putative SOS response-associated peptidase YedK
LKADVAQLVEQPIRNRQVSGSSPLVGSILFAGLWDRWKDPSGNWIKTCSILTTTPNAVTAPVHDRMPVILDPDSYDL